MTNGATTRSDISSQRDILSVPAEVDVDGDKFDGAIRR